MPHTSIARWKTSELSDLEAGELYVSGRSSQTSPFSIPVSCMLRQLFCENLLFLGICAFAEPKTKQWAQSSTTLMLHDQLCIHFGVDISISTVKGWCTRVDIKLSFTKTVHLSQFWTFKQFIFLNFCPILCLHRPLHGETESAISPRGGVFYEEKSHGQISLSRNIISMIFLSII